MKWEIYFKTEDQHIKIDTVETKDEQEIRHKLIDYFPNEVQVHVGVTFDEYPEDETCGKSIEYSLTNEYYVYGYHALNIREQDEK